MEFSKLFVCASFGIVWFSKFGNFLEISGLFELAKISEKISEISLEIISCFWVKKPCFGVKKFGKSSETGDSEHSEFTVNWEFVLFRTFQKLRKNDIKIEFRKSQKTRSDSKTDSYVWFKVHDAWP
jgi:hypothetical protein